MDSLKPYRHYLAIVAILVVARFVWLPLWEAKQDLWLQLTTVERNLSRVEDLVSRQNEISQQATKLTEELGQLNGMLEKTNDLTRYRVQQQQAVEQLAKANNLELVQSSWQDGIERSGLKSQSLQLRIEGGFEGYINFLQQLRTERFNHFYVSTTEVGLRPGNNSSATVQARLSLNLLVQVQEETDA